MGVDSGTKERSLPILHVFLALCHQLQLVLVLVHIPREGVWSQRKGWRKEVWSQRKGVEIKRPLYSIVWESLSTLTPPLHTHTLTAIHSHSLPCGIEEDLGSKGVCESHSLHSHPHPHTHTLTITPSHSHSQPLTLSHPVLCTNSLPRGVEQSKNVFLADGEPTSLHVANTHVLQTKTVLQFLLLGTEYGHDDME